MLYAYELPRVDPFDVVGAHAYERLTRAGLVHVSRGFSPGSALLASRPGVHKAEAFGAPIETHEGWTFYPPAELPPIHALRGPHADAPGNHPIPLRLGGELTIRPAYLEPRLVFSEGVGDRHVTTYGRVARALRDSMRNGATPDLGSPEVLAVIILAIQTTYPCPSEVLDALNAAHPFLTDDDLQPILDAVFAAPFPQPAAAG